MKTIQADKWILLSGLQKTIRRNDVDYAQQFAMSLFGIDKRSFWRRLPIIAMEDIGLGEAHLMLEVCRVAYQTEHRKSRNDEAFILGLVTRMANAPKNHAIDHLVKIAMVMPTGLSHRRDYREQALDKNLNVYSRAAALLHYAHATKPKAPDLYQPTIEAVHGAVLASKTVYDASQLTLSRMDNDMPLLFPLLGEATTGQDWSVRQSDRQAELIGDLPAYAFDPLHTRLGKAAIRRWRPQTPELQMFTERQIAKAVFNLESITLGVERCCDLTDQIKADGISASLIEGNLIRSRHDELFSAVKQAFSELNRCRAEVWHFSQSN